MSSHQLNPAKVGAVIGAVGGLVFVLVNATDLPGSVALRVAGVVAFAAVITLVVALRPPWPPTPTPAATSTYAACVVAEVVAIPVGAGVLDRAGHAGLVPVWVVLVVGAHFLPFARIFKLMLFGWLGAVLVSVALVGALLALAGPDRAVPVAAVVAGFVLLAFSAAGLRTTPSRARVGSAG